MELTVDGVTVRVLEGLLSDPIIAVIIVEPTPTPVASPLFEIVAKPWLLEIHVKLKPEIGIPLASVAVPANCWVWPTWMDGADGVTVMESTVGVTVSVVSPFTLPMVAVIMVEPSEMPVVSPSFVTVATFGLLDVHVKVTPGIESPLASIAMATNCKV